MCSEGYCLRCGRSAPAHEFLEQRDVAHCFARDAHHVGNVLLSEFLVDHQILVNGPGQINQPACSTSADIEQCQVAHTAGIKPVNPGCRWPTSDGGLNCVEYQALVTIIAGF